jgi:hypothetical protein
MLFVYDDLLSFGSEYFRRNFSRFCAICSQHPSETLYAEDLGLKVFVSAFGPYDELGFDRGRSMLFVRSFGAMLTKELRRLQPLNRLVSGRYVFDGDQSYLATI